LNILITGATGFIGQAVVQDLLAHTNYRLSALTRKTSRALPDGIERLEIVNIDGTTDYGDLLTGFDVIIHLAARVHRLNEKSKSSYPAYKALNVDGTENLARQAADAGVKRFIYLSSIKVNGESTAPAQPFMADDTPNPSDAYALSKFESEQGLIALSKANGMQYVIIRPPLVYGPGVKANFQKLMGVVRRGVPLPFGSIHNRRSLVSLDNLASLIRRCIDHPNAANEIFLVSDDHDVSTTELMRIIADAMNVRDRLILFPKALLSFAAALFGKQEISRRLLDNLQVDITKTKSVLGWQPEFRLEDAIRLTARNYLLQAK
jgi:UDP-4-keto-D-QuiNAc 4-reductase